jgi:predicted glutamine amidotransferase
MCRIFLSFNRPDNHRLVEEFIKQGHINHKKHTPLLKNHRDNGPHKDGTGFAVFRQHKWKIYKSISTQMPEGFTPKQNELTIGHLRKKCKDFPGHISENNTHPFFYQNKVMLHNGFIHDIDSHPTKYYSCIDKDLLLHIKGETDTEILFFIYMTYLRKWKRSNDGYYMIEALREMLAAFVEHKHQVSANIIFADSSYIVITRYLWANPKKHKTVQHALSLYYDVCDGIVISSEPVTEGYRIIPENTALLINIKRETMVAYPIIL